MQNRMQGLVLVIVLFILAMMTIVLAWLSDELLLSVRRTANLRDMEQAWQLAVGSEKWGASVLVRDLAESERDHLNESWNNLGAGVEVEEGKLDTRIIDLQSRFNLNNLYDETEARQPVPGEAEVAPVWTAAFQRLLIALELDPGLAAAVLDWLDIDQNVRGSYGAEDSDYLAQDTPYRAANRMLSDVSELLWIKGFDSEVVARLAPYVTVLPATDVRININTAPVPLLRVLGGEILSQGEATTLAESRPEESGFSIGQFLDHAMMTGEQDVAAPLITDTSGYFVVLSRAEYGRAVTALKSLVKRDTEKVTIISRRQIL